MVTNKWDLLPNRRVYQSRDSLPNPSLAKIPLWLERSFQEATRAEMQTEFSTIRNLLTRLYR